MLKIMGKKIFTILRRNFLFKPILMNVDVVGFGKAVSGMARTLENHNGQHIVRGIISIPHGSQVLFHAHGKEYVFHRILTLCILMP